MTGFLNKRLPLGSCCRNGRLTCAFAMPPPILPMTAQQIPNVLVSGARALQHIAGQVDLAAWPTPSNVRPEKPALMLHLLNNPEIAGLVPYQSVTMEGTTSDPSSETTGCGDPLPATRLASPFSMIAMAGPATGLMEWPGRIVERGRTDTAAGMTTFASESVRPREARACRDR